MKYLSNFKELEGFILCSFFQYSPTESSPLYRPPAWLFGYIEFPEGYMVFPKPILIGALLFSLLVSPKSFGRTRCIENLQTLLGKAFKRPLRLLRSKNIPTIEEVQKQGSLTLREILESTQNYTSLDSIDMVLFQEAFEKEFKSLLGMNTLRTGFDEGTTMKQYAKAFGTRVPLLSNLMRHVTDGSKEEFLNQPLIDLYIIFKLEARKQDQVSQVVYDKTVFKGESPGAIKFTNSLAKWKNDPKVYVFIAVTVLFVPLKAIFMKMWEIIRQNFEVYGLQRSSDLHKATLVNQAMTSLEKDDKDRMAEILKELYGTDIKQDEINKVIRSSVELYAELIIEYRTAMNETASWGRSQAVTIAMNVAQIQQTIALAQQRMRELAIDYAKLENSLVDDQSKSELEQIIINEREDVYKMLEYAERYGVLLLIGNVFAGEGKFPSLPTLPEEELMDVIEVLNDRDIMDGEKMWDNYLTLQRTLQIIEPITEPEVSTRNKEN